MMNYANIPGYSNYKTYDLFTFSFFQKNQERYGGRYSGPLHNWTGDSSSNADFKIILEHRQLKATIIGMTGGVADLTGTVEALVKVFDKDGKLIYNALINAVDVKF
jgi:hypothetical protein